MNRIETALTVFKNGFNCSQSVLSAYSEDFNINRDTALKIAAAFGGGMARTGNVCGAVTGAYMVLGLNECHPDKERPNETVYEDVIKFIHEFEKINGSIICRELIKCDIGTQEGHQKAKDEKIFINICPNFIKTSIEILERILK